MTTVVFVLVVFVEVMAVGSAEYFVAHVVTKVKNITKHLWALSNRTRTPSALIGKAGGDGVSSLLCLY